MGVRLIIDESEGAGSDCVAMYDSVSGWAFGPVFSSQEEAEGFLAWVEQNGYADARMLDTQMLAALHSTFVRNRAEAQA